jgi:hypothetical protein
VFLFLSTKRKGGAHMSKECRIRILQGCGWFWLMVGIFLVIRAFRPMQLPFDPSLLGLGIALFALCLMHWDKAESLKG